MDECREDEEGFTLIELTVVVLIIAILITIAIPTFVGAPQKAQDRAAESDLRNALTAARTAYVDTKDYTVAATQLVSIEPSLTFFLASPSDAPSDIAVNAVAVNQIGMAYLAADGTCWALFGSTAAGSAGTTYGSSAASPCNAPAAALPNVHW